MTQLEREICQKSVEQLAEIADGSCGYSDDTRLFALTILVRRQSKEIESLKRQLIDLSRTGSIGNE